MAFSLFLFDETPHWCKKTSIFDDFLRHSADVSQWFHYILHVTLDKWLQSGQQTFIFSFRMGPDSFEHQFLFLFLDLKWDAGYSIAHQELITRRRCDISLFKVCRFFIGNDDTWNGAECVFSFRFQSSRLVCLLLSAVRIARHHKVFCPCLLVSTVVRFGMFCSRDGHNTWTTCFTHQPCWICLGLIHVFDDFVSPTRERVVAVAIVIAKCSESRFKWGGECNVAYRLVSRELWSLLATYQKNVKKSRRHVMSHYWRKVVNGPTC